jgi:hypothetical protein
VRRQDLDGDVATELAVARAIHLAHAAHAERRDDRVRPERVPDHHRAHVGTSRAGHHGRCRRFQEPCRLRLVLEERFDPLTQGLVALTR